MQHRIHVRVWDLVSIVQYTNRFGGAFCWVAAFPANVLGIRHPNQRTKLKKYVRRTSSEQDLEPIKHDKPTSKKVSYFFNHDTSLDVNCIAMHFVQYCAHSPVRTPRLSFILRGRTLQYNNPISDVRRNVNFAKRSSVGPPKKVSSSISDCKATCSSGALHYVELSRGT